MNGGAQITRIIFFIPGRIRIKAGSDGSALRTKSRMEQETGILSVYFSFRTKNILVCYDPDLIDEEKIFSIIDKPEETAESDRPSGDFFLQDPPGQDRLKLLSGKRGPAARWTGIILLIGGIASAVHFAVGRLLSFLLFSCPLFIAAAPAAAAACVIRRAGGQGIRIRNKAVLDRFEKTEALYLSDSVLSLGQSPKGEKRGGESSPEIYDFVFGMREHGVTDIAVLLHQHSPSAERAAGRLGINGIYSLDNADVSKLFRSHSLIVIAEGDPCPEENSSNLVLQVLEREDPEASVQDLAVRFRDLPKIPRLLGLGRYGREIAVRSQNIAIALSSLGILFATLGYLSFWGALIFYGLNIAWQPVWVGEKILSYQEENDDGGQLSTCQ